MKLCLIGPAPPLRGGIAAHSVGLAEALEQRGHAVSVVSFRRLYPDGLFPGASQHSGTARPGPGHLIDTLDPRSWRACAAHVRSLGCDAVLVQWWHPILAPALLSILGRRGRPGRVPVVVVAHNVLPHEHVPGSAMLARAVLARADGALCHSRHVAAALARLAPRLEPRVSPMPLLLDPACAPATRADARAQLGLDADGPLAAFVGHVRGYKGPDVLARAWKSARLPAGARLLVAGESYLGRGRAARGLDAIRDDGSVTFIDRYLDDGELLAAVAAANLVVLPYRRASQSGLAPLAHALAVPILVSDAGGLAEIAVGHRSGSRASGMERDVVRAGDAEDLARRLPRALGAAGPDGASYPSAERRGCLQAASWAGTADAVESLVGGGAHGDFVPTD